VVAGTTPIGLAGKKDHVIGDPRTAIADARHVGPGDTRRLSRARQRDVCDERTLLGREPLSPRRELHADGEAGQAPVRRLVQDAEGEHSGSSRRREDGCTPKAKGNRPDAACRITPCRVTGVTTAWIDVAEEVSDISLACQQTGPIRIKAKFEQGDDAFRKRRSLFFKKMQIVRGCDVKRNVLVYMVYSDRIIEGSPKNSTSSVPIMPWGSDPIAKCADWIER
jgi:hypothetical protein